jgi:amidase
MNRREAVQLLGAAAATKVFAADAPDICFLSAGEIAALIRRKNLSAREVLAAHLKQIERLNPQVNAIVTLTADQAIENAPKADEATTRGVPLAPCGGLPVVHKGEAFGATNSPYDLTRTCEGSSGGAAVSVACGVVPIADGSDSSGSLRNPPAFCNVGGLGTAPGRVATTAQGNAWSTIIVGRHRDEWSVVQLAHTFEQATKFGRRRPPIV